MDGNYLVSYIVENVELAALGEQDVFLAKFNKADATLVWVTKFLSDTDNGGQDPYVFAALLEEGRAVAATSTPMSISS